MDASEKQGYLGDLAKKTSSELSEILKRQQKLLQNVKFINKLPDKGERIQNLTSKINAELESRMDVDATADLFHQMALNAEKANRERGKATQNSINDGEDDVDTANDPLKEIVNRASVEKQIIDNRNQTSEKNIQNSYEKVIKRAGKNQALKKKFYPHKTVKTEHIDDLSGDLENIKLAKSGGNTRDVVSLDSLPPLESPPNSPDCKHKHSLESKKVVDITQFQTDDAKNNDSKTEYESQTSSGKNTLGLKSENPKLKHRYDESLEMSVYSPSKKYQNTKLISIEESIEILENQRKKQELLQAKHAGNRLAQRLGIKMADFEPKHQEMRYRSQINDDVESGSSDSEVDYPD